MHDHTCQRFVMDRVRVHATPSCQRRRAHLPHIHMYESTNVCVHSGAREGCEKRVRVMWVRVVGMGMWMSTQGAVWDVASHARDDVQGAQTVTSSYKPCQLLLCKHALWADVRVPGDEILTTCPPASELTPQKASWNNVC